MNVAKSSKKTVAVLLAFLTLLPVLPVAEADHTATLVPDLPVLPPAKPGECVTTAVTTETAAAVNAALAGNTGYPATLFKRDQTGVPMLCVGAADPALANFIRDADKILHEYRNTSALLQRQADERLEATLPAGDIVRPQFTVLADRFDGRRVGGFGEWTVVTEKGEEELWQLDSTRTLNGTVHTYRFGTDQGYVRGAHQWLVSPELDLTALRASQDVSRRLVIAKTNAIAALETACAVNQAPASTVLRDIACAIDAGAFGSLLPALPSVDYDQLTTRKLVLDTYRRALEDATNRLPIAHPTAYVDITYRSNMALGEDGVRVWAYVGDQAPDRVVLSDPNFGVGGRTFHCPDHYTELVSGADPYPSPDDPGNTDRTRSENERVWELECIEDLSGGHILDLKPAKRTNAFKADAPLPSDTRALTGDVRDFVTQRVNLTNFTEKRVWLLFEVKTQPNLRGESYFDDKGRFPRQEDYGFELASVIARGEGYHRNFRVKDVGANLARPPADNPYGDDPNATRTDMPPGNEGVVVRLHNAGQYVESGNLTVTFELAVGAGSPINTTRIPITKVRPSEVREVHLPWPAQGPLADGLTEGSLYRVRASLRVDDITIPTLETETVTDPATTPVRIPNQATETQGAGCNLEPGADTRPTDDSFRTVRAQSGCNNTLTRETLVRAYTNRRVVGVPAFGGGGNAIEICSDIDSRGCVPSIAAGRGEPRVVLVGVRNLGNAPEDARAHLELSLDGVPRPTFVLDGSERSLEDLLPGERRGVTWTLSPNEPGVYTVRIYLALSNGTVTDVVERLMFVQRSSGLVCFDDLELQRACGPAYTSTIPDALADQNLTALTVEPDGGAYATSEIGENRGALWRRAPDGSWKAVANLSYSRLNATLGGGPRAGQAWADIHALGFDVDGSLLLGGANSTLLRYADGAISRAAVASTVHYANVTAFQVVNGTLWAAAEDSVLLRLNRSHDTPRFERFTLYATVEGNVVPFQYGGDFHDLAVAGGVGYLAGDSGLVWRSLDGTNWTFVESQDSSRAETAPGQPLPLDRDVLHLVVQDDRLYAFGHDGLALRMHADGVLRHMPALPAGSDASRLALAFATHLGDIALVTEDGRFVVCSDCANATDAGWWLPEVPVPALADGTVATRAALAAGASAGSTTLVVGEGGVVLELIDISLYENREDWSRAPDLVMEHGGAIQTRLASSNKPQGWRLRVDPMDPETSDFRSATRFRVTIKHHIPPTDPPEPMTPTNTNPQRPVYLRLLAADHPSWHATVVNAPLCPSPKETGGATEISCGLVMFYEHAFDRPTATDTWAVERFEVAPNLPNGEFHALELYKDGTASWAIDEVQVDGLIGGVWRPVVYWRGPDPEHHLGVPGVAGPPSSELESVSLVTSDEWSLVTPGLHGFGVLGIAARSPWHISHTAADRPVWAANDEMLGNDPSRPRLLDYWDSRLVTPIVDLGSVEEPVLSFRHAYSFRTEFSQNTAQPGDVGVLEVQYRRTDDECRALRLPVPCWSEWRKLYPDEGYPNALEALGLSAPVNGLVLTPPPNRHQHYVSDSGSSNRIGNHVYKDYGSFWGRSGDSMLPDRSGAIVGARDTDTYQEVTVNLAEAVCNEVETRTRTTDKCLPTSLAGREVRFGFRIIGAAHAQFINASGLPNPNEMTFFNHTNPNGVAASFPGEGWYITDIKVKGAPRLGTDLRATNMTLVVGYDPERGVGPGTEIPVRVTVENRGVFDVLGYTGTLDIRRVVDPAAKRSVLVESIPLRQQPLLEAEASANHTFLWRVPPVEDATYLLEFRVAPIGQSDEDPTDNLARVGRYGDPLLARTIRGFDLEVIISPENATGDVTRTVAILLNNTGNVPLGTSEADRFTVVREVRLEGRTRSTGAPAIDPRCEGIYAADPADLQLESVICIRTDRPVPPGSAVPLAVASSKLDPTTDVFWKPLERSRYRFVVSAVSGDLADASTVGVAAFATYLFDDVDGGLIGSGLKGEWQFEPGWSTVPEGFRSQRSYGLGDRTLYRYTPDIDASLVTPTIDLTGARSARLSLYHRYAFEPGFDGGVVEASVDGGVTWVRVQPEPDRLNALPLGYNDTHPLSAASALHPTGDPSEVALAFTGDSSRLPFASDGWVLSVFDLTNFANITLPDVEYAGYHAAEIGKARGQFGKRLADYNSDGTPDVPTGFHGNSQWQTGDNKGQWLAQDATEQDVVSPLPGANRTFWWSGSTTTEDDGVRPDEGDNWLLRIPVDLSDVKPGEQVVVEWWEWANRDLHLPQYYHHGAANTPGWSDMRHAFAWHTGGSSAHTVRFNVSEPKPQETPETRRADGWIHMVADITDYAKDPQFTVEFLYAPYRDGQSLADNPYKHDRGFAIDGFTIKSFALVNGQPLPPRILVNESVAWQKAMELAPVSCAPHPDWKGGFQRLPCFVHPQDTYHPRSGDQRSVPGNRVEGTDADRVAGKHWSLVEELPALGQRWTVVNVRDEHNKDKTLEGDAQVAWYSGALGCTAGGDGLLPQAPCLRPGMESRLVTPPFDLSRISGSTANLSFWHRYAFHNYQHSGWRHPIPSGGVVEVQHELTDDECRARGESAPCWSEWTQLYERPDALRTWVPTNDGGKQRLWDNVPRDVAARGGYSAYAVPETSSHEGFVRYDIPLQMVHDETVGGPVGFLYSGASSNLQRMDPDTGQLVPVSPTNGWVKANFDMRDYLGKTVRFAFRVHMSGQFEVNQLETTLSSEDQHNGKTGWWIRDVGIVGKVLAGAPVQLRLRAATDGDVSDGYWQVDDLAVYGARYGRNLAIFVDQTPELHGAVQGRTTVVPVTIRNLGDSFRRDVGFDVRYTLTAEGTPVATEFSTPAPVVASMPDDTTFRVRGIDLAPGKSVTIPLNVTPVGNLPKPETSMGLVFKLTDRGQDVPDNEVQGLLATNVTFHLAVDGSVAFPSIRTEPARPRVGEPVNVTVTVHNDGYVPIELDLDCEAYTVGQRLRSNHRETAVHEQGRAAEYACEETVGAGALAPGAFANVTYRVVPTVAGALKVVVGGKLVDGINNEPVVPAVSTTAFVGQSPIVLYEDFSGRLDVSHNWTPGATGTAEGRATSGAARDHLRGHFEPGSLRLGPDDNRSGPNYHVYCNDGAQGRCRAVSQPIDLHNFSRERLFLTFWHLDRFARNDGGNVSIQVLEDERSPYAERSWSEPCYLKPVRETPYEGRLASVLPDLNGGGGVTDTNPGVTADANNDPKYSHKGYPPQHYVSDDGTWEHEWSLAVFDLKENAELCDLQDAGPEGNKQPQNDNGLPISEIAGRTVRIQFEAWLGPDVEGSPIRRGPGHAWFIDDVSIGPLSVTVRPVDAQRAILVDNATKTFHVVLENRGDLTDVVRLRYDAQNSSAPEGSILAPGHDVEVPPRTSLTVPVTVQMPRDPSLLPTTFKARIVAQSLLDPTSGGHTDFAISFAPRPWPELSVSVDAPSVAVQEGTELLLPVTIENEGLLASGPLKLAVLDTLNGATREVATYDIDPIPGFFDDPDGAFATYVVGYRPDVGAVGDHVLTFVLDREGRGEEYTRDNNVATVPVKVVELRIPDLAIAEAQQLRLRNAVGATLPGAVEGDVTRYEVTAGEVVTFELKIRNEGHLGAEDVDVRAFIGTLSLPPKRVPYIPPGSEVALTFSWLAQKGDYAVSFLARSEQSEVTLENNEHPAQGLVLLTVKGFDVAVAVDDVAGLLEPGDERAVNFTLTNTGNAGEDLRLVARAPGLNVTLPREGIFLRAGETYAGVATVVVPAAAVAGEQLISVEAVARENPMKVASDSGRAHVRAFYGGRVVPLALEAAPTEIEIPVRLANEGNSLDPWRVTLRLPPGWTTKEAMPAEFVVPAYAERTVVFHAKVPDVAPPGERILPVNVTLPNGEHREGTVAVDLLPHRAAVVKLAAEAPKPGQGVLAYPVTVQNAGNLEAPFEMILVGVPKGVEARMEPATFALPPGGKAVATLLVKADANVTSGVMPITGYTAFEGVSPSSREGRANLQSLKVNLLRPELVVGAIEYAPRAEIDPGERVTVKVPLANEGQAEVLDLPVHLYVDDRFVTEARVARLAPGERTEVTLNWTALDGDHTLTVVVDPYHDLVEADVANNAMSALAAVGGGSPAGGLAAGRAPVPAPGLWGLAVAFAAAVVIARGRSGRPPE